MVNRHPNTPFRPPGSVRSWHCCWLCPSGVLAAQTASPRPWSQRSIHLHALPGVVVGLSLVYLGLSLAPATTRPLWLSAYAVLFPVQCDRSIRSATAQVSRNLEDMARTWATDRGDSGWRVTANHPGAGHPRWCIAGPGHRDEGTPSRLDAETDRVRRRCHRDVDLQTVGSFQPGRAPTPSAPGLLAAIPAFCPGAADGQAIMSNIEIMGLTMRFGDTCVLGTWRCQWTKAASLIRSSAAVALVRARCSGASPDCCDLRQVASPSARQRFSTLGVWVPPERPRDRPGSAGRARCFPHLSVRGQRGGYGPAWPRQRRQVRHLLDPVSCPAPRDMRPQ